MKPNYAAKLASLIVSLFGFSIAVLAQPSPATPASPATTNIRAMVAAPTPPVPLPPGLLAFDAESKELTSQPGEVKLNFSFYLTNISSAEIVVTEVKGNCFCTVAKLPVALPWKIPPGGSGPIPFILDLTGKTGILFKTVTINTDKGLKTLSVKANIIPAPPGLMSEANRQKNQELMKADRQAVFKGECVKCHVEPVIGKVGKELYTAACGICHEAEHRATMVPDLHNLPNDTNAEYWKLFIANGKPATLMPAFSQAQGGPLSEMQIASLVEYLVATMPALGTNSRPPAIAPAKP